MNLPLPLTSQDNQADGITTTAQKQDQRTKSTENMADACNVLTLAEGGLRLGEEERGSFMQSWPAASRQIDDVTCEETSKKDHFHCAPCGMHRYSPYEAPRNRFFSPQRDAEHYERYLEQQRERERQEAEKQHKVAQEGSPALVRDLSDGGSLKHGVIGSRQAHETKLASFLTEFIRKAQPDTEDTLQVYVLETRVGSDKDDGTDGILCLKRRVFVTQVLRLDGDDEVSEGEDDDEDNDKDDGDEESEAEDDDENEDSEGGDDGSSADSQEESSSSDGHHYAEVLVFGMYVLEYPANCSDARCAGRVYIGYLDKSDYYEAEGGLPPYRTIVNGYLEYVSALGYSSAHIWSCPPHPRQNFYIFNNPNKEATRSQQSLNEWYEKLLKHGGWRFSQPDPGVLGALPRELRNMLPQFPQDIKRKRTLAEQSPGCIFWIDLQNGLWHEDCFEKLVLLSNESSSRDNVADLDFSTFDAAWTSTRHLLRHYLANAGARAVSGVSTDDILLNGEELRAQLEQKRLGEYPEPRKSARLKSRST